MARVFKPNAVIIITIAATVIAAVVYFSAFRDPRVAKTRQMLRRLASATEASIIINKSLPVDVDALLANLTLGGLLSSHDELSFPGIAKGYDPWGRKVALVMRGSGMFLVSFGRNGRDEGGSGDDIEVEIDCSMYLKLQSSAQLFRGVRVLVAVKLVH